MEYGTYKSKGLTLCTDSFSIEDIVRLMNVLIIRYDFNCTLPPDYKGHYRIYISRKFMEKVRTTVKAPMIPSMLYKIGK